MTLQQMEQLREALRPLTETRDIERRFSLSERCDAVVCLVHAMDHIAKHEPDMLARINAGELIRDGIINALDSRSTGREHRTVRHRYRNERDGPHPPVVAEIDRRCQNCGAADDQSLSYCHAHRPPTIASLLDPVASEPPIADLVRIWSGEHSAWWRPEGGGYTQQRSEAWITDRDSAVKWTCHCGQEKRIELQPICRVCCGSGEREVGTAKGGCPCLNCMGTGTAAKGEKVNAGPID